MKLLLLFLIVFYACLLPVAATAEVKTDPAQLLTPPVMLDPPRADGSRCFFIINTAPYTVAGGVNTNYYDTADGGKARANRNFRLKPQERTEICTFGPFYSGERVELVLRSLVPLFSCYTVAQGEILVRGEIRPEGGTRTWAECQ